MIAQPLIIEHQFLYGAHKLRALPVAFHPSGLFAPWPLMNSPDSPDRIGGCAQFMRRHMRNRHGLRRSIGCKFCGARYLFCRTPGVGGP